MHSRQENLPFIFFSALALLFGCVNADQKVKNATANTQKVKASIVVPGDTVIITIDSSSHTSYKLAQLKNMLKTYPALNLNTVSSPDTVYNTIAKNSRLNAEFTSEVGQDDFYGLYTYFLKKKLDTNKYNSKAGHLIEIYRDINNIFQTLIQGGTYFGHMGTRIPAIAWYDIYINRNSSNKTFMPGQKALYIDSLKTFISRKIDSDNDIFPERKKEFKQEIFKKITAVNILINNYPDLKATESFQRKRYIY